MACLQTLKVAPALPVANNTPYSLPSLKATCCQVNLKLHRRLFSVILLLIFALNNTKQSSLLLPINAKMLLHKKLSLVKGRQGLSARNLPTIADITRLRVFCFPAVYRKAQGSCHCIASKYTKGGNLRSLKSREESAWLSDDSLECLLRQA